MVQDNMALAADAYLAWWSLAGVNDAIAEGPVDWLRPVAPAVRPAPSPPRADAPVANPIAPPAPSSLETPGTLALFQRWLADDAGQPERRWPGPVILPRGEAGARLMVITDLPDPADLAAGTLLADRAGQLFDAMLAAIGLSRDRIYLASLFSARPPGGMVESADLNMAARRMRAHVALAKPARLLLLGDRTARSLLPSDDDSPSQGLRSFNLDGGTMPAIATLHPRLLLGHPSAKAECWHALQSLIEEDCP